MKTKHLRMAILFSLVSTSAQLQCNPMTEYEQDGVCCRKCGPGTKMQTMGACLTPICRPCAEDEYQDSYTTASKCKQQPYCDPNKNFQPVQSKTRLISCQCQAGFKCSSELCVTCVLRRTCPPGHEAINTSDQLQDTICEKCPAETFSSQSSWNNTCKRWTKCEHGEETPGTDTTDRICMSTPSEEDRNHVIVAIIAIAITFIIGITALAIWCWKKKGSQAPQTQEAPADPHIPWNNNDCDLLLLARKATETEDPSVSSGGNLVTQEWGKTEQFSVEESQTTT